MWRYILLAVSVFFVFFLYVFKHKSDKYELYQWEDDKYSSIDKKAMFKFIEQNTSSKSDVNTDPIQDKNWQETFKAHQKNQDGIWSESNFINVNNVETILTKTQHVTPQISIVGQVASNNIAALTSPEKTSVLHISAKTGESIRKGELLYQLDESNYEIEKAIQLNSLNKSELDLTVSKKAYQIITEDLKELEEDLINELTMFENGLSTSKRVQELRNKINRLKQDKTIQTNTVELMKSVHNSEIIKNRQIIKKGEQYRVIAPFDAVVLDVQIAVGNVLDYGQPTIKLMKNNSLFMHASLSKKIAQSIYTNKIAEHYLVIDGEKKSLATPSIVNELKNGVLETKFKLKNPLDLLLGSYYEMVVELEPVWALQVPKDSIYDNQYVYIVKGSAIYKQEIKLVGSRLVDDQIWLLIDGKDFEGEYEILLTKLIQPFDGAKVNVINTIEMNENE